MPDAYKERTPKVSPISGGAQYRGYRAAGMGGKVYHGGWEPGRAAKADANQC